MSGVRTGMSGERERECVCLCERERERERERALSDVWCQGWYGWHAPYDGWMNLKQIKSIVY